MRTRRRPGRAGWAVSIALHALLLGLLLGPKSGNLNGAPENLDGDMVVSLVSASALAAAPQAEASGGELHPLLAKFNPDQAPVVDAPSSEMSKLLSRVQAQEPRSSAATQVPQPRPAETDIAQRAARDALDGQAGQTGLAGPTGQPGLWGAMEPCWKGLATASAIPVTLEVTLDLQGHIAKQPQIVRPAGLPDEPRLRAEAHALQALAECLPRNGSRFGGQSYRLDFRPEATAAR